MKGEKKHLVCDTWSEHGGKSTREGDKNGVGRRERMERGRGMNRRDERSRGADIHTVDAFAMIKPTEPFKLAKHTARRKQN